MLKTCFGNCNSATLAPEHVLDVCVCITSLMINIIRQLQSFYIWYMVIGHTDWYKKSVSVEYLLNRYSTLWSKDGYLKRLTVDLWCMAVVAWRLISMCWWHLTLPLALPSEHKFNSHTRVNLVGLDIRVMQGSSILCCLLFCYHQESPKSTDITPSFLCSGFKISFKNRKLNNPGSLHFDFYILILWKDKSISVIKGCCIQSQWHM